MFLTDKRCKFATYPTANYRNKDRRNFCSRFAPSPSIGINKTVIHRRPIQRTFAELYSVPPRSVDVVWVGESITVRCAGKIFTHQTGGADNEFVSKDEDPVTVTLSAEKRAHLAQKLGWLRNFS
jgi:hypothetical protein